MPHIHVCTFEHDTHVRKCTLKLGTNLCWISYVLEIDRSQLCLVKILVSLYNKVGDADAKTAEPDSDRMNHAAVLAELLTSFQRKPICGRPGSSITTWMEQLGTIVTRRVYSTKLKNRIFEIFSRLGRVQARPRHTTCFQPGSWSSTTKGVSAGR